MSGAVNAKEGMDEYALWPCKFKGYKLQNLTQVGAAANTSLGQAFPLKNEVLAHKQRKEINKVAQSFQEVDKNRFKTSYGSSFSQIALKGAKQADSEEAFDDFEAKKVAYLTKQNSNRDIPFQVHRN